MAPLRNDECVPSLLQGHVYAGGTAAHCPPHLICSERSHGRDAAEGNAAAEPAAPAACCLSDFPRTADDIPKPSKHAVVNSLAAKVLDAARIGCNKDLMGQSTVLRR